MGRCGWGPHRRCEWNKASPNSPPLPFPRTFSWHHCPPTATKWQRQDSLPWCIFMSNSHLFSYFFPKILWIKCSNNQKSWRHVQSHSSIHHQTSITVDIWYICFIDRKQLNRNNFLEFNLGCVCCWTIWKYVAGLHDPSKCISQEWHSTKPILLSPLRKRFSKIIWYPIHIQFSPIAPTESISDSGCNQDLCIAFAYVFFYTRSSLHILFL